MTRKAAQSEQSSALFSESFSKTILTLFIAFVLFVGGVVLLALRLPGWGLFLGIPATQIGIIFLIFTFDEITRKKIGLASLHEVPCPVCGQPTLAPSDEEEKLCLKCQKKINKRVKASS